MKSRKQFTMWHRSALLSAVAWMLTGAGSTATMMALGGCARADEKIAAPVVDEWAALQDHYKYDASKPLDVHVEDSQMGMGGRTETATIVGSRGDAVPLYLIIPTSASADNKVPGIVLLHGLGGKIEEMQIVGQYLALSGFAVVIPEIVGHGQRADAGKPIFDGDVAKMQNSFYETVGDVQRAIDYMSGNPNVDKNRIGLVGMSLGSILGSITQAVDPRIKTSVLLVGGGDWKSILATSQLPQVVEMKKKLDATPGAMKELETIDPVSFAGHIAPRSVLMINGKKDNVIPEAAAKALFASLRGKHNKQIWLPGGHTLIEGTNQTDFLTQIGAPAIEWLQRELDPKTLAKRAAEPMPIVEPKADAPKADLPVADEAKKADAPVVIKVVPPLPDKTKKKTPAPAL